MRKSGCVIAGSILFFIVSFSETLAQPMGERAHMRMWRGKVDPRCRRASELLIGPEKLKGLNEYSQTYLRETRLIRAEILSKRLELRDLLRNPEVKIEAIQQKGTEIIELQRRLEEKGIEYLFKVRSLLSEEQLKDWCPEQELPYARSVIHIPEFMGPMMPEVQRKIGPQKDR